MLTYYKNSKIYQHVPIFKLLFALWLMSVIVLAGGCSDDSSFTVLKAKIISPGNDIEIKEGEAVFLKASPLVAFHLTVISGILKRELLIQKVRIPAKFFSITKEHTQLLLLLPIALVLKTVLLSVSLFHKNDELVKS